MDSAKPERAGPRASGQRGRRLRRRPIASRTEDSARSLEELRSSIVGPERARIERLEARGPVAAESVAPILPEAVAAATTRRQRDLAAALEPTVTDAVVSDAQRRPDIYAAALAPTIGSAVKKAVAEEIALLMERFNAALERSLTVRSIQWRFEAARTGRPFGEVALLHTLVYRVEQVFLIHTRTSLVLQHLVDPTLKAPAADQVAAMLSALETFAREAFGLPSPEGHVNRFEFGDLTVWISQDPYLTLAAVVRGTPSVSIATQMDDTLAGVRVRCSAALRDFTGEVAVFDPARPLLEPLLRMERTRPPRRAQVVLAVAGAALVAALVALVAWARLHGAAVARNESAHLAALQGEPGIVVDRVRSKGNRVRLSGLRDPLAAPPETIVAEHGLAPATFELAPFVSLDPRIVERRAERVLLPPPSVQVRVDGRELRLAGTAPREWIDQTRLLGRAIVGVDRLDDSALRSRESVDALRAAASKLDGIIISFRRGTSMVDPDQEAALNRGAERARAALQAAAAAKTGACLVVTGHADVTETAERSLSIDRAAAVGARLGTMHVDGHGIRLVGAGLPLARSVGFHVDIDESRFVPGCLGAP